MTSPLSSFIAVQFIVDPAGTTPPANVVFDQQQFLLPPEYLTAIGSGPTNPGEIRGVRGYHQVGGPTGHQWVMISSVTPALIAQFNAIPPRGWTVPAARQTYRTAAQTLLDHLPAPDVVTLLTNLYTAAMNNERNTP